ncbi:glucose dehydrogenase [Halobacteriales archaeon SW_7_71_33]|nr:MAG: glucose dehydrogenase [Halobacteriales archaeon SW_7_71_33]
MYRRRYLSAAGAALAGALAGCAGGDGTDRTGGADGADGSVTDAGDGETAAGYAVEPVVSGLTSPWAVTPLSDESALLVTERPGRLQVVDPETGTVERVDGTPAVFARGQGGLLDVALHPAFPDERWVYLTYAVGDGDGRSTTALGRGRLDRKGPRLRDFERLHAAEPFVRSSGHFGSRVTFRDGDVHDSQTLGNELGTTLRLRPDGSVPEDNPFVDRPDARDAIYSYGHRNAQGMTVHPETGALWQSEFGERDGDEINVVERGANYGWPVADNSCEYGTDEPVGVAHGERPDVVAPVYGWPCGSGGFPPAGTTFYDGAAFPEWRGDLFVGGLASQYLARFAVDGRDVEERAPLLADRDWRVRAVAVGPESGHLYVAVDAEDAPVVRLRPA